jgi:hypothetical protein
MQWFYDGQIRRYITQSIRVFSNFVVKYGDGTLVRVPVMYGDQDRQVANILRQNSENKINSTPRIALHISGLDLDSTRLGDSSYIGKVHVRERDVTGTAYNQAQGRNYTVERLMPTPFKLTMKVDIWSANTDQKLQLLEQILVLFNPTLELQTTENYLDWTSLSVLSLTQTLWSSRTVPVGNDSPIDLATLTFEAPIWISPPVKVKHLGVIRKIVTSMYENADTTDFGFDGLGGADSVGDPSFSGLFSEDTVTISNFGIQVYNGQAMLMGTNENELPRDPSLALGIKQDVPINWQKIFDQHPEQYKAGSSRIYLTQPGGTEVVGTVALNSLDSTLLMINYDLDTLTSNTGIDSNGYLDTDISHYSPSTSYRPASTGTFDAIINPLTYNPKRPTGNELTDQTVTVGKRFLIIEDIGDYANTDGADAWKHTVNKLIPGTGVPGVPAAYTLSLVAKANDIIEWSGTQWNVIFDSTQETDTLVWQTNIYTNIQYLWNGVSWTKSFEGIYKAGQWRIEL